jgi:hypothetical protein
MSRSLAIAIALFFTANLRSEAQSITVTTGQDAGQVEQLGCATSYTGVPPANSPFPYNITWSYRQTDCSPPSSFRDAGVDSGSRVIFGTPGTFEVRAVFTYRGVNDRTLNPNPPAAQTVTRSVTIAPPAVIDIRGDNVATPYAVAPLPGPSAGAPTATSLGGQPGSWIYFILRSSGKTIGPYFNCTVQEKITKWSPLIVGTGTYAVPKDGDWRPNNPLAADPIDQGPDSRFLYRQPYTGGPDYAICDFKPASPLRDGSGAVVTGTLATYTQENRIFWNDYNGNQATPVPLGAKDWTINGLNDTQTSVTYR